MKFARFQRTVEGVRYSLEHGYYADGPKQDIAFLLGEVERLQQQITLTPEEAEEVLYLIGDPEDHYGDPDHPLRTLKTKLFG